MVTEKNKFHLSTSAARGYESHSVPAIFAPLAQATFDKVELPENAQVLDIACGTGIISRLLADQLKGTGRLVGSDLNPAMLEVAKELMPASDHAVEWIEADAGNLPFDADEFDALFCQQGLQFFPDKLATLREFHRVLKPGGHLYISCWSAVPALLKEIARCLTERVNEDAARKALAPFQFRDDELINSLLCEAGFDHVEKSVLHLSRRLHPGWESIRVQILSSPYEKELRAKGDDMADAIATDVEEALTKYRDGEDLVLPQESFLFQATKAPA
ncbi:MAG: class I SAM-dependent methyltransferase [Hyphomicrobiales bacterium]